MVRRGVEPRPSSPGPRSGRVRRAAAPRCRFDNRYDARTAAGERPVLSGARLGALKDSRATVTVEMEDEYLKMRGELKKRAAAVQPIGFFSPEMLKPTREKKHD